MAIASDDTPSANLVVRELRAAVPLRLWRPAPRPRRPAAAAPPTPQAQVSSAGAGALQLEDTPVQDVAAPAPEEIVAPPAAEPVAPPPPQVTTSPAVEVVAPPLPEVIAPSQPPAAVAPPAHPNPQPPTPNPRGAEPASGRRASGRVPPRGEPPRRPSRRQRRGSTTVRVMLHRRLNRPAPSRLTIFVVFATLSTLFFMLTACATALAGGAGTVYAYNYITRDLPNPNDLANRPLPQVTQIFDRTGEHMLYEFYEERRIIVPLRDVSPDMIKATLAAEDVNFYSHRGYDVRSMVRAAVTNFKRGETVQGASTITQQLVKRMLLSDERTYIRKLREVALAAQVESRYSKDQILEMYLNQVYYGNQAYGVEAAAISYFGVHARDLDLAQSAILAGLVQLPTQYDPVQHPQAALRRQAEVLDVMVRYGMVAPEEAEAAKQEAATYTYRLQETNIREPHFSFFVKEQLQQRINPDFLRAGLRVVTTLDLGMQETAQAIVRRRIDAIRWQHVNNGALVALNPRTGEILAMVGSYDYHNQAIDGQVNVATAPRQPGSSFKPFTYATAFATRKWAPASTVADRAVRRVDIGSKTGVYEPTNYDGKYHGTQTFRSALANSYNIPALLVQDAVGTKEVIKTARKLGITTELPEVASLTLGAGTVRLLEMTAAYGVFANGGVRVDTTPFRKITTVDGRVLYELGEPYQDREIWPEVAYMVNDILADAAVRRPMFGNVLDLAGGRTAAVKTGTTNDYRDSWTIGYTPSLVTGVWVGNTDNSPMLQVAGSLGAGFIWKDFMDSVLRGQPDEPFPVPPGIVRAPVCPGKRDTDLFMADAVPGECPPTLEPSKEWQAPRPTPTRAPRR